MIQSISCSVIQYDRLCSPRNTWVKYTVERPRDPENRDITNCFCFPCPVDLENLEIQRHPVALSKRPKRVTLLDSKSVLPYNVHCSSITNSCSTVLGQ